VVIVDITAEWCTTCKVNKFIALGRGDVLKYFKDNNVVAMQADLTINIPKHIRDYLNSFGRNGIPLNVVYGPNAKNGIMLPVLLTTSDIYDAMNKASKE
jgi:suppressor for copper-sensitivity B